MVAVMYSQLANDMKSTDLKIALEASKLLNDYYDVYNAEWDSLVLAKTFASAKLIRENTKPGGPDPSTVLGLESTILHIKSRFAHLDAKMIEFRSNTLEIEPPNDAVIDMVKNLSASVAATTVKVGTLAKVLGLLSELKTATDGMHLEQG
jgi:hypothetical protein